MHREFFNRCRQLGPTKSLKPEQYITNRRFDLGSRNQHLTERGVEKREKELQRFAPQGSNEVRIRLEQL